MIQNPSRKHNYVHSASHWPVLNYNCLYFSNIDDRYQTSSIRQSTCLENEKKPLPSEEASSETDSPNHQRKHSNISYHNFQDSIVSHKNSVYLVSSIYKITVSEHWCKVALALSSNIMMVIMVVSTTIKWNIFCGSPGKVVTA